MNKIYNRWELAIILGGISLFFTLCFTVPIALMADEPAITECETEIINAFTSIDIEFEKKYGELLELQDITAVAKSTRGNIEAYTNTYACHANMICPTVVNYLYQTPSKPISFPLNECNIDGKTAFTSDEVSKRFKADLKKCSSIGKIEHAGLIIDRCTKFTELKKNLNEGYTESEFIKQTHLENNSFLSLKLLDINKKLDVLLDKVRTLSTHFKKVNDDISCVNPDGTGL